MNPSAFSKKNLLLLKQQCSHVLQFSIVKMNRQISIPQEWKEQQTIMTFTLMHSLAFSKRKGYRCINQRTILPGWWYPYPWSLNQQLPTNAKFCTIAHNRYDQQCCTRYIYENIKVFINKMFDMRDKEINTLKCKVDKLNKDCAV